MSHNDTINNNYQQQNFCMAMCGFNKYIHQAAQMDFCGEQENQTGELMFWMERFNRTLGGE